MFRLVVSPSFKKQLRNFLKRCPELREAVENKFSILENNPRDSRLRTHKLAGKLKDLLAASITREYRIIFYFENKSIFLIAIGTHDEVY